MTSDPPDRSAAETAFQQFAEYAEDAAAVELTLEAHGLPRQDSDGLTPIEAFAATVYPDASDKERRSELTEIISRYTAILASHSVSRRGPREVQRLAVVVLTTFAAETGHRGIQYRIDAALEVLREQAERREDPGAFAQYADSDKAIASAQELASALQRSAAAMLEQLSRAPYLYPGEEPDDESGPGIARMLREPLPSAPLERDGMLAWDAVLADLLEELGDCGRDTAQLARTAARERWAQRNKLPARTLWRLWLHDADFGPSGPDPRDTRVLVPRAFRNLARALWRDKIGPQLAREHGAPQGLHARVVVLGEDKYTHVPKLVAPLSWAFGAPGHAVDVDGDHYAKAPSVAADVAAPRVPRKVVPRSFALLPQNWTRPHQGTLALGTEEESSPEQAALPVAIATATQYAISPVQAKVALVTLADPRIRKGQLIGVTLGELTRFIFEGNKRIQARELEAVATAVRGLRSLLVYLPDDTTVQLFDTKAPAENAAARADMSLLLGLSRSSLAVLGQEEVTTLGATYRGEFLFNLTGAMRLPNKRPALLRHYARAAAHWNAAFDPQTKQFSALRLPTYTWREWAILTNALPPSVVEYLASKKGPAARRFEVSKAIKEVRDNLEELALDHGLIRIERVDRDHFRPLPPQAWLEAKKKAQAGGTRSEAL